MDYGYEAARKAGLEQQQAALEAQKATDAQRRADELQREAADAQRAAEALREAEAQRQAGERQHNADLQQQAPPALEAPRPAAGQQPPAPPPQAYPPGQTRHAWLGLRVANVPVQSTGPGGTATMGLAVAAVVAGAPAAAAGLRERDVIVRLEGEPVGSAADFIGRINTFSPGDTVHIGFFRDGRYAVANAVLTTSGTQELLHRASVDDRADYARERDDFGIPPGAHPNGESGWTPVILPGATVVTTTQLMRALQGRQDFYMLDVTGCDHPTLPGAACLRSRDWVKGFDAGLMELTAGARTAPVLLFCHGAGCWMSYDAARRALDLGFREVFWYRGGLESWQAARNPLRPAVRAVGPA